MFGMDCLQNCSENCYNKSSCNRSTGACLGGCISGWRLPVCTKGTIVTVISNVKITSASPFLDKNQGCVLQKTSGHVVNVFSLMERSLAKKINFKNPFI